MTEEVKLKGVDAARSNGGSERGAISGPSWVCCFMWLHCWWKLFLDGPRGCRSLLRSAGLGLNGHGCWGPHGQELTGICDFTTYDNAM